MFVKDLTLSPHARQALESLLASLHARRDRLARMEAEAGHTGIAVYYAREGQQVDQSIHRMADLLSRYSK